MDKKEKNSKTLTLVKKTALSAAIGHAVAILFLFLTSTALAKNEDPSSLMPVAALVALFIGAAICGLVSGKAVDGPFGGAISGLVFSGALVVISLVLNAFSPSGEDLYGIGFKIGMLAGATLLSALVGLWVNGRKNPRKSMAKQRKKAMGR